MCRAFISWWQVKWLIGSVNLVIFPTWSVLTGGSPLPHSFDITSVNWPPLFPLFAATLRHSHRRILTSDAVITCEVASSTDCYNAVLLRQWDESQQHDKSSVSGSTTAFHLRCDVLHWLPIRQRVEVEFKLCLFAFNSLLNPALGYGYLTTMCQPVAGK